MLLPSHLRLVDGVLSMARGDPQAGDASLDMVLSDSAVKLG
ncbi:MAG: hypothetical protein R3A44_01860 [Caldilineaceae bacterium]